jgi:DDE superfamily endonuclease
MPVPIICLDESLRYFAQEYRRYLSKPQYQYFVTVLAGLLLCEGRRVLSALLRQVSQAPSLEGLSRFLSQAPWQAEQLARAWFKSFEQQMQPLVQAEQQRQQASRPKRRARPKGPLVTGYLIGDDSTMQKVKGKKMQGLGKHHSTTHKQRVVGHSLLQGLYLLLGRRCPLAPQLYRQKAVCRAEGVAFQSKIALMEALIRGFEPVPGTLTHVLLDSWYSAKCLWKAARERGFLITTGLKSNRWLRIADKQSPTGWCWQQLSDYASRLGASDYVQLPWPRGGKTVFVHVISTRVRKLYRCQVIIVRQSLDDPLSQARYWASSDLHADAATLLSHLAARWEIEVLFEDGKEELGLDHYQLMSAKALVRFWTLAWLAYVFLEQERARLQELWQRPVTIGEARREFVRRQRRQLLIWLSQQFQQGVHLDSLFELLAA